MNGILNNKIPLSVKLSLSLFVIVLVPYYLAVYGPTNFLYFCDVALFMTLIAMWREDSLLASMAAVGILLPQAIWCLDFLLQIFGARLTGMTGYMFDDQLSLFSRGLSLFHIWLPLLLLWLVARLGYDRRALACWTVLAWFLLLICYFYMPASSADPSQPANINYVYGFDDTKPQQWMNQNLYFVLVMIGLPLIVFLPTHLILQKIFNKKI